MKEMLDRNWHEIRQRVESLQMTSSAILEGPLSRIALFGAGAAGHEALSYLQSKGVTIQCVIDNSPQKQGGMVNGIPVVSVDHPLAISASIVLITTKTSVNEIRKQLQALDKNSMPFDAFFVLDNLDRYTWVRNEILTDDVSRVSLDGILLSMLTSSFKYCTDIMDATPYFCLAHFQNIGEESFVDAGAYVGDTVERFIWANTGLFRQIHVFEPGIVQFNALRIRMNRLIAEWAIDPDKISMVNAGLAENNGKAYFGTSSSKLAATALIEAELNVSNEYSDVDVWSLDSYLSQKQSSVSFIKADIEGMEVQMLRGACRSIGKYKPKLAISVYHKPSDLFEVIEIIRSCAIEYKFSLRHHSSNLSETVLYGWVDSID